MFLIEKETVLALLNDQCIHDFGCELKEATLKQVYRALCVSLRDLLIKQRNHFLKNQEESKEVFYMSMEFLVGTSLRNNLYNMGVLEVYTKALRDQGIAIDDLFDLEPDAGLGNGGLGRLASCYLDAMTTLSIPATGFSIRYEFGIFRQKIVDGWQMEFPDDWLNMGDVWLKPRPDETYPVHFGGTVLESFENGKYQAKLLHPDTVMAVPYDMFISGYHSTAVNKLVLWSAKSPVDLDMSLFSRGEYVKSLENNTMAEVISKVLYPADDHIDGKKLRIRQQYLLVSASLQSIVGNHVKRYGTLDSLPEKVAIHINDTHPALCVPELMRILLDECDYSWEKAWDITCNTLTYTNHTVMSEALERWSENLFRELIPRIYMIVCEINRRLFIQLKETYHNDLAKIEYMSVIANGEIRMANLCLACCHKVNGVSALHTEILKTSIFRDYNDLDPNRFINVTNGIAYRRWLCQANPGLSAYLSDLIGPEFTKAPLALEKLLDFKDEDEVLSRLQKIKLDNKERLAAYIRQANGINVDPTSLFDVQIKRLHEYKRQLLNVLYILDLYGRLKENPNLNVQPRTFLFAAKASSGYVMAKQIISLIVAASKLINADPAVRDKLKVIFLEDYKVSLAEIIIPAAEISQQISMAGKEASGTGNMKLMINGGVTLGTLDGANVEILQQVGPENMFLFGLRTEEVNALLEKGYHPGEYLKNSPRLQSLLNMLSDGSLGKNFGDIAQSLRNIDPYLTLADFESYSNAQEQVSKVYQNHRAFSQMSLVNIAKAGFFSADRSVSEYANNIWNL